MLELFCVNRHVNFAFEVAVLNAGQRDLPEYYCLRNMLQLMGSDIEVPAFQIDYTFKSPIVDKSVCSVALGDFWIDPIQTLYCNLVSHCARQHKWTCKMTTMITVLQCTYFFLFDFLLAVFFFFFLTPVMAVVATTQPSSTNLRRSASAIRNCCT